MPCGCPRTLLACYAICTSAMSAVVIGAFLFVCLFVFVLAIVLVTVAVFAVLLVVATLVFAWSPPS